MSDFILENIFYLSKLVENMNFNIAKARWEEQQEHNEWREMETFYTKI